MMERRTAQAVKRVVEHLMMLVVMMMMQGREHSMYGEVVRGILDQGRWGRPGAQG
jgi:hypothetical protein